MLWELKPNRDLYSCQDEISCQCTLFVLFNQQIISDLLIFCICPFICWQPVDQTSKYRGKMWSIMAHYVDFLVTRRRRVTPYVHWIIIPQCLDLNTSLIPINIMTAGRVSFTSSDSPKCNNDINVLVQWYPYWLYIYLGSIPSSYFDMIENHTVVAHCNVSGQGFFHESCVSWPGNLFLDV